MATQPGSTPHASPWGALTGAALSPAPIWAANLACVILVIGALCAGILIWHNARLAHEALYAPTLTNLTLPLDRCPKPRDGQVLHISVVALDLGGEDLDINCILASAPPPWARKL